MGGGEEGAAFEANEGEPEAEEGDGADVEAEQALAEFDFLVQQQDQQPERSAADATAISTDSTDAADENAAPHAPAAPAVVTEADSLSSLDALGECLHTFNETLSPVLIVASSESALCALASSSWRVRRL